MKPEIAFVISTEGQKLNRAKQWSQQEKKKILAEKFKFCIETGHFFFKLALPPVINAEIV